MRFFLHGSLLGPVVSKQKHKKLSVMSMSVLHFRSLCQHTSVLARRMSLTAKVHNQTKVEVNDGCYQITMCNSKTRNSLSLEMMKELTAHIKKSETDSSIRTLVIKGEGPVFSAGHNLKELTKETGSDFHRSVFKAATELVTSILTSPVPVIAAINGLAAAAGCQLVAACDMAICTEKSSFSTPGARFGIFCSTPGIPLVRSMPLKISADMLFTARTISAQEALSHGLVSRVTPEGHLDKEINKIASDINEKSRSVIELGKKFLYVQREQTLSNAYRLGENVMVANLSLPDGEEGIRSFVEKRKPEWKP